MPMTQKDGPDENVGTECNSLAEQLVTLKQHLLTREAKLLSLVRESDQLKIEKAEIRRDLAAVRRQNGDLVATNNRYLERARMAEMALDVMKDTVDTQKCQIDAQAQLLHNSQALVEKLSHEAHGRRRHLDQCEQIAAKALGYMRYMDDQENFPGADETNGYFIGEHVGDSIVEELATAYGRVRQQVLQ